MSTGPGPTQKADGSHEASVDEISSHLVEEESEEESEGKSEGKSEDKSEDKSEHKSPQEQVAGHEALEPALEVVLETPGPVLPSTFLPPPPAPPAGIAEDSEGAEETAEATNLAYDDLLAKLVLPAKASEPTPAPMAPVPFASEPMLAEATSSPALPEPVLPAPDPSTIVEPFHRFYGPDLKTAPPEDERTLVTENPLVAEEQEAAVREGRVVTRNSHIVRDEMRPVQTERVRTTSSGTRTKLVYMMMGFGLAILAMVFAVVVSKLFMPSPAPQSAVMVAPAVPPPPAPPPARVEPLPASEPVAPAAAAPAQPEPGQAKEAPVPAPEAVPAQAAAPDEKAQPKAHKPSAHTKAARAGTDKLASPPKAATAVAAPAKPAKPAGRSKAGKAGGWADPFEN